MTVWFYIKTAAGNLAFLTPFVFLLLHRLVTCPFSVKPSPSGTDCFLLSSLLRISLLFGQRSDVTLFRICSAMVSLGSFLSFLSLASPFLFVFLCLCLTFFVPCFLLLLLFLYVLLLLLFLFLLLLFHSPGGKTPD